MSVNWTHFMYSLLYLYRLFTHNVFDIHNEITKIHEELPNMLLSNTFANYNIYELSI